MPAKKEDPAHAARHCLTDAPYRMVVFDRMNQQTPLYRVAGSIKAALGAKKALEEAFIVHGGKCFFCKKDVKLEDLSIDHAEAKASGGKNELQNLLISHKACNREKGDKPIEAFDPDAGREWLTALLTQIEERLIRLGAKSG